MTLFEFMDINTLQPIITAFIMMVSFYMLVRILNGVKQTNIIVNEFSQLIDESFSNLKETIELKKTDSSDMEQESESESDDERKETESDDEEEQSQLIKTLSFIENATDEDLETIVSACSSKLLIPNWYTQKDFEELTDSSFSKGKWKSIVTKESDELIGQTSAMMVQWYDNKLAESMDDDDYKQENNSESESESETESEDDIKSETKMELENKKKEWTEIVNRKKELDNEINKLDQDTVKLIAFVKNSGSNNLTFNMETHNKMAEIISRRNQIKEESEKLDNQQVQLVKKLNELIESDSSESETGKRNNETSDSSDSEYETRARKMRNTIKNRNVKRYHFRIRKN